MIIRSFDFEKDFSACQQLALDNFPESHRVVKHIRRELSDSSSVYFVAEHEVDGVIGFAGVSGSKINYDIYEFVWCNVAKKYQGQKLGRRLVERRIEYVRACGGSVIILTTPHPEIYKQYGFRTTSTHKLWTGDETALMVLDL